MDITVSLDLVEEDSELTRFIGETVYLESYEAVGESSDEEVSDNNGEEGWEAEDGIWTTATVLTVDSDNTGTISNGNEEIEFTITARSNDNDYVALLESFEFSAFVIDGDDDELLEVVDWEVSIEGMGVIDEGTGIGAVPSHTLYLPGDLEDAIELENGDSVTIVIDFGGSAFTNFLVSGGRYTVELVDVAWTDDSEEVVGDAELSYNDVSPEDLELEWLYRDLD